MCSDKGSDVCSNMCSVCCSMFGNVLIMWSHVEQCVNNVESCVADAWRTSRHGTEPRAAPDQGLDDFAGTKLL